MKTMMIRESSLRCKSKRISNAIVANYNDEDRIQVSPIAVASNRMIVRINDEALKHNKKQHQHVNGLITKVESLEKKIQ